MIPQAPSALQWSMARQAEEGLFDCLAFILSKGGPTNQMTGRQNGFVGQVTPAKFTASDRNGQAGEVQDSEHTSVNYHIAVAWDASPDPGAKAILRGEDGYVGTGSYRGDYDADTAYIRGDAVRVGDGMDFYIALAPSTGQPPATSPLSWMKAAVMTPTGSTPEASGRTKVTIFAKRIA